MPYLGRTLINLSVRKVRLNACFSIAYIGRALGIRFRFE